MANPAIYGMIGAIVGALVTSAGALILSSVNHRHEAAATEAGRKQQVEDAAAKRDKDEQAAAVERRNERINHLVRLRTTGRAWQAELERAVQELELGHKVNLARFDEAIRKHDQEVAEATHAAAAGPIVTSVGPDGIGGWLIPEELSSLPNSPPVGKITDEIRSRLLGALRIATEVVREEIIRVEAGITDEEWDRAANDDEKLPAYRRLHVFFPERLTKPLIWVRSTRRQFEMFLFEQVGEVAEASPEAFKNN